jgi:hypothetical protein
LLAGLFGAMASLSVFASVVERDRTPLALAFLSFPFAVAFGAFAVLQARTTRVLRWDPAKQTLSVTRLWGSRRRSAIESPIAECDVAVHPVHFNPYRGPRWDGFAILVHLRQRLEQTHFAIGVFKSRVMATNGVEHLPPPLKAIYRGDGPDLRVGLYVRLTSRRSRRASRGHCPKCGYDLSGILAKATCCPECGWHGSHYT